MNKASHSIALCCRVYGVTRDGYNAWRRRGESTRRQEDSELFERIHRLFKRHDGCYGSPKITRELRKAGIAIGQKRVARIMREHRLKAVKSRIYKSRPGTYRHIYSCPCGIVDIRLERPNQLWVGDITYIRMSDESWQFLSVIMDRYSRRIIAWSLSDKRDAALTMATLERAVRNRGHHSDLLFHSDRGTEYLAARYKERLRRYGITQSMN